MQCCGVVAESVNDAAVLLSTTVPRCSAAAHWNRCRHTKIGLWAAVVADP